MNRILSHERVRCLDCLLVLTGLVIRVHELELDLSAQLAERKSSLHRLKNPNASTVVLVVDRLFGEFVCLGQVVDDGLLLIVSGTTRRRSDNGQQDAQSNQFCRAHSKFVDDVC
jgi:hypothetical protein